MLNDTVQRFILDTFFCRVADGDKRNANNKVNRVHSVTQLGPFHVLVFIMSTPVCDVHCLWGNANEVRCLGFLNVD